MSTMQTYGVVEDQELVQVEFSNIPIFPYSISIPIPNFLRVFTVCSAMWSRKASCRPEIKMKFSSSLFIPFYAY